MKAAAIFLVVSALANSPSPSLSAKPVTAQRVTFADQDELVRRLRPILLAAHKAGRVYFPAVCPPNDPFKTLSFPRVHLEAVPAGLNGVAAVRAMFPKNAVVETRDGIISVRLGSIPTQLLQTRISKLRFSKEQQYEPSWAVGAVKNNAQVHATMRKLRYSYPISDITLFPSIRNPNAPHLPPTLFNLTMDQALDRIATTFGSVVFFGACERQRIYLPSVQGGYPSTSISR